MSDKIIAIVHEGTRIELDLDDAVVLTSHLVFAISRDQSSFTTIETDTFACDKETENA